MDFCDELLKLNELASESKGNLTGILDSLLVFDTRNENFHSLNNRFPGGFLLISQLKDYNQEEGISSEQQGDVGSLRTQIFDHQDFDSIKLCICQDLNSAMTRSCLLGLLKHYSQFIGINSKKEQCGDVSQEVVIFTIKYKYMILESNLIPLSFKAVRDLLYILVIKQVKLNSRIVFYVEEQQSEIELGPRKKSLVSYIILDPKGDESCEFNVYTVCNPTGFLTKIDSEESSCNKVKISEIISNELVTSSLSSDQDNYYAVSRFDIYSESNLIDSETQKENSPLLNDETILHNKLNRSKCINVFPGTCFSLFVRWNLEIDDVLYPNIPKINPTSIDEGLIFLKIDINKIKDPSLISIIEGINFLECLISSNYNYEEPNLQNHDLSDLDTQFESKELHIIALKFIRSLSEIWGYSIMEHVDLYKEEKETNAYVEKDKFRLKGSPNGRIDADYTDLLWGLLVNIREEKLIFNIVLLLLDELEKSCSQQLYENRFIPQVRNDNTTTFSKLIRIAVDIYKGSQYLGKRYESSKENEGSDFKEKHTIWKSIRNKYFGEIKTFRFVLMEIGFECIMADMKMHVRKSEPLIDDSSFDWHLNNLYSESKQLLEEFNLSELNQKNKELLGRIRKLIPVCYISNILNTYNCSWDISKKLIRSSIKYYSNQEIQEALPTIFLVPVFNKTVISQMISSNSPNQIEISSCETQGGSGRGIINLNKVDSIELPSLDSELNESIIKLNRLPICVWKTLSDLEESRHIPNHYTIQIEKSLT
ncbi:uncharacterized protein cubi_00476 [Cryptosporidium ubiquitum]|uniref:Uncharacterized protein n=1 Tax=Cryptosporidium ubiquitum TaxID=857276 RepID=A0A1J4ME38_9CRYT|nr:uncharacterized protein cubi_00476 [Cryptosporidium ubiquitum]OII72481.1 hypothetical protein cubi_00476 [Cryptosporidium ubiquitum]